MFFKALIKTFFSVPLSRLLLMICHDKKLKKKLKFKLFLYFILYKMSVTQTSLRRLTRKVNGKLKENKIKSRENNENRKFK